MRAVSAPPRRVVLALGSLLFLSGLALVGVSTPRFVWLNAGPSIEYPWSAPAAASLAAVGAAIGALRLERGPRWLAAAASIAAVGVALHLLRFRISAQEAGLSERGLAGTRTLAWRDVGRVESGSRWLVLWGPGELQVRIDTASFAGEDRARLDRTIARRVREATGR